MAAIASPAIVTVMMDGAQIEIVDADMNFFYSNGSRHSEGLGNSGRKEYMLHKGGEMSVNGTVLFKILKTPDGKADDSIDKINKAIEAAQKETNPEKYNKPFVFVIENSGAEKILEISFQGHVKEMRVETPEKEGFPEYNVDVVLFDAATFKIS